MSVWSSHRRHANGRLIYIRRVAGLLTARSWPVHSRRRPGPIERARSSGDRPASRHDRHTVDNDACGFCVCADPAVWTVLNGADVHASLSHLAHYDSVHCHLISPADPLLTLHFAVQKRGKLLKFGSANVREVWEEFRRRAPWWQHMLFVSLPNLKGIACSVSFQR